MNDWFLSLMPFISRKKTPILTSVGVPSGWGGDFLNSLGMEQSLPGPDLSVSWAKSRQAENKDRAMLITFISSLIFMLISGRHFLQRLILQSSFVRPAGTHPLSY